MSSKVPTAKTSSLDWAATTSFAGSVRAINFVAEPVVTHSSVTLRLSGGPRRDTLAGQGDYDGLIGGSGNDELIGGRLDDRLHGGTGDDVMRAGPSRIGDTLRGGPGDDQVVGGRGLEIFLIWRTHLRV